MTYEKWAREKYRELDKMVKKNSSVETMAATMKINKQDLYYRLNLLKTQTNIRTWTEDELILLERSKNMDEFMQGCLNLFGKEREKKVSIDHWTNRDKYLSAWFREKGERKKIHDLEIKNKVIPEPIKEKGKPDTLPDIGDQMAKLINRVTENTAVLNDLLKVQRDTYALFEKLDGNKKTG